MKIKSDVAKLFSTRYLNPLRVLAGVGRRASALSAKQARDKRCADAQNWLSRHSPPFKVNLGCGKEPLRSWTNVDIDSDSSADILWDVTDGLPFPDNSCAFIYSEHFLEHLPVGQGVQVLAQCHRCLRNDGVMRIGMPSAHELIRHYYENVWAEQSWLQQYGYAWVKTRAEYINICFRDWGHQWLYDLEELERRLREAGFTKIVPATWGQSEHTALNGLETRKETLLICEATK